MKNRSIHCVLLLFGSLAYTSFVNAHPRLPIGSMITDSVGVEKKNGKRFILHRVDEGQTLYAIARRYKRSVAEIRTANPELKESVRYGQLVKVPVPERSLSHQDEKTADKELKKQEKEASRQAKAENKDARKTDDPAKAGIHVVEAGQTLYSLASRYGVSQDDLRKWNNLAGNNVLIGQALIVSEKAHLARMPSTSMPTVAARTPDTPARTVAVHPAEPRPSTPPTEPRPAETRPVAPAESKPERRPESDVTNRPLTPAGTAPAEVEIESPRPGNDAPMPVHGRRISDSGVAEMIEGADGSGKYLALHRTAPIGTLVQVRNEFNNQSIWVKVIGRLPNTGINDKILIKLSTQAFAKLSPTDRRFRAEVSYIVR
ncbi:DPBB and LysM peptidoglycan-binding domain-containing protein [Spirosoma koreense]